MTKENAVWDAETDRRMALQKTEFDAAEQFARQIRRHYLTAVVDDDYPFQREVRHDYESALRRFLEAAQANRGHLPIASLPSDFMSRLHEQNAARSARWHPKGLSSWSLSDWFTALAGEVGEAGNVIKKLNRSRDGLVGNRESDAELHRALEDECADVLIYLELLSQAAGFVLEHAVARKFNAVSERHGFPERL